MQKISTYLKQLKFDPKLANSLIAKYISNPRLVILLSLAIIILGVTSYISLPRNLNPEIKIPIVIVSTVLPGAGPKDVESLVTIPIEDSITGLSRVKTVTSISRDSISIVTVQFDSGVDPEKARTDIKSAVDSVSNLPKDAKLPNVQKLDFANQPVWTFALTGGDDLASLTRYARILRDKIKELPSVDKVVTTGLDEQEIQIVIKPETFSSYKLNPQSLAPLISSAISSFPAGSVKTNSSSFTLSIDQDVISVNDVRNLRLNLNGNTISLSDIAQVIERSKPDQAESILASPNKKIERAVNFDVYKTSTAKIDDAVADVRNLTDQSLKSYHGIFAIQTVRNTGEEIDKQFNELIKDFTLTIILVFFTLLIFLGLRQAIVASSSAPLTFLISFVVMKLTSISLSFISLFSLLLALGLLVDDTIVVISAMTSYYRVKRDNSSADFRTGKFTPLQTGLLVWRDFLVAVFTTTITTVWAFLPLLLSTGIIGEFIKPIPIVVSTTLMASFFVAMFVTLPFIIILLKPNIPNRVRILVSVLVGALLIGGFVFSLPKNNLFPIELAAFLVFLIITFLIRQQLIRDLKYRFEKSNFTERSATRLRSISDQGLISLEALSKKYKNLIERILSSKKARIRTIVMVIVFSVFSYLLLPLGFVKNEFFPKSDQDFIFVSLELPSGTSLDRSNQEAVNLLDKLKTTPELEFVTANIGQSFNSQGGIGEGGFNNILFSLKLKNKKFRKLSSIYIGEKLRLEFRDYKNGNLSIIESTGGPPAGADLQIKLFGDDLATLDQYADKLQNYLKTQSGAINIDKSIKPGTSKLVFVPDKDKMSQNNLTADTVGFWLRMFASGFSPNSVKFESDGNEKKDITIRVSSNSQYLENVSSLVIPGTPGQTGDIPISSLGILKLQPNPTLITREDGKRTISVTASVRPGFSVSTMNKQLEKYADSLNLPAGLSWKTGGVNEENQNSVNSILQAMVLSFLLIIITMVIQFNSFRRALIVMLVIPLSISGVFIIFSLTNTPLSFPALIGVLALFGIVVKNSILIVDKIVKNNAVGMSFQESIADGASSRLEAIGLTSMTAIIGLIPITLSDPIWQGLGGAIIAGLTFSGTIMLFFIPVVYYYFFTYGKKR
ncbi:efflux RND transporter permease subunit [Candidatus Daviesbacteria bacterium]|nr:efflux RND transporter permease subunit [Candidatus Daviesbacteria bacterium]